ncbi:hypothetical protein M3F59_12570 [Brachybacterium muris]|uniref:hypothetical protein n=1 Tax=Brachybacterium muris TaxID=219301 RepID=UPI00223C0913|nr:hypothetical protein [Brachybacterium muris]MCT2178092.1 hypothetical protein [Brachybacterium muris]MCT2262438.1 hypothetical protein [Brachybacterium muris]
MSLTRRNLLLAGTLGAAFTAGLAPALAAPANASADAWTEEFMTRPENRMGFDVNAIDEWQTTNARFIIAVCAGHGFGYEGTRVTLITAIVESWLYNYEPAVDHDSGGLFQQRPSMGWGTYDQVRHKKLAIDAFLGLGAHASPPGLLQLAPDYKQWEPGAAAQAVQRSAHPGRYSEMLPAAQAIWERHAHDVAPFVG